MSLETRHASKRFRRKITGYAACLLPFEADGGIARTAFQEAVARTTDAGLGCAVNMDTGYANYLTAAERTEILGLTKEVIAGRRDFVAGVFVEGLVGDLVDLYRRQMDEIVSFGGTPILFQTTRFHEWAPAQIIDLYAKECEGHESFFGFERGKMFATNGMMPSALRSSTHMPNPARIASRGDRHRAGFPRTRRVP